MFLYLFIIIIVSSFLHRMYFSFPSSFIFAVFALQPVFINKIKFSNLDFLTIESFRINEIKKNFSKYNIYFKRC
jgi:hypothetical protein